jgi:hypothetical protein
MVVSAPYMTAESEHFNALRVRTNGAVVKLLDIQIGIGGRSLGRRGNPAYRDIWTVLSVRWSAARTAKASFGSACSGKGATALTLISLRT